MLSHKTPILFLFLIFLFSTVTAQAVPLNTGAPDCDAFLEEMAACFDPLIRSKDDQDNVDAILTLSAQTMRQEILKNSRTKAAVINECKATMKRLKKEGCEVLLEEKKPENKPH